ncbi:MAG TPA: gliding motility-associated C-terminal domain-containing protein, partial [Daejeonella sp.]|nr:gliding motility-associated C-terminal domain-containing protein [Daejeonella sp.]
ADTEGPITVSYSSPGIKTVVLQAFGDKECAVVTTYSFTVTEKPEPPEISINKTSFCLNETVVLSTPVIDSAVFAWTGPNGFTSNQPTVSIPVADYNVAGSYSLTITLNGCTSDPSTLIVPPIMQTPLVSLDVTENNPCTNELTYTISYTASDYQQLSADFGPGFRIVSGTGNGPYTIAYSTPGPMTITVTATSSSGCSVTVTKAIDVPAITPKPVIQINKNSFCVNDTIVLTTTAVPNTTYVWSWPNNFTSTGATVTIPVTSINFSGEYTLVATNGRCSSEAASIVIPEIIKIPVAAFTSEPNMPAILTAPANVQFLNNSTDADSYLWDFGDGSTSTEESPSHEYTAFGEYNITLTAYNRQACSTSITKGKFVIRVDNNIVIPNTFTPNADQVNDEFVVTISNIVSYRLQIYNRYGSPLFQTNDIFENWKGVYKNAPLPVGTYYYIIDAVSISGEPIKKAGSISLIR